MDTGVRRNRARILEALKGYHVNLIYLTHGHCDHTENALFFAKEFDAPIAIHKLDEEILRNNTAKPIYARNFLGRSIKAMSEKAFLRAGERNIEADVFLQDEQGLQEYGIPDAKVVHLGGHTAGSTGILLENGAFIAGDVIMNMLRPGAAYIAEDLKELSKSVEKVKHLPCKVLYVGHGKPVFYEKVFGA